MVAASLLEILLKALLIPLATLPMPTVAAKAINATTRAYSMRSCPLSSSMIWILVCSLSRRSFIDGSPLFLVQVCSSDCEGYLGKGNSQPTRQSPVYPIENQRVRQVSHLWHKTTVNGCTQPQTGS